MKVWIVFTVPQSEGQDSKVTSVVDCEEKALGILRAYKGSLWLDYEEYEVE